MKYRYIFLLVNLFIFSYCQAQTIDSTKPSAVVRSSKAELKNNHKDLDKEKKSTAKDRKARALAQKQVERTIKNLTPNGNGSGLANSGKGNSSKTSKMGLKRKLFKNYDGALVERSMNFEKSDIFDNAKQSEKNKREAAVILGYMVTQELEQYLTKVIMRKKIQLNSKGAVDELSNFHGTFVGTGTENQIFVKLIKPNGLIEYVNFTDAIVDSTLISAGYTKTSFETIYKFEFKVAIPNLEVGDILEIGTSSLRKEKTYRLVNEYAIKENFPIENLQFRFISAKRYKIYCKSTNTNILPKVDTISAKNEVLFSATDLPKVKTEQWQNAKLQNPYFNIVFEDEIVNDEIAKIEESNALQYARETRTKPKVVLRNPSIAIYNTSLSEFDRTQGINRIWQSLSSKSKTYPSAALGSDFLKAQFSTDYLPMNNKYAAEFKETILLYYYNLYRNYKIQHLGKFNERALDKMSTIGLIEALMKYDIPFKLLVTSHKNSVRKEEMIDFYDMDFAVLVDEKPIYPPFGHSKIYDINPDFEGQDFWVYYFNTYTDKFQLDTSKIFSQPVANFNAHIQSDSFTVKVDKDFKNLVISTKALRTGKFTVGTSRNLFIKKDTIPEKVIDEMLRSLGVIDIDINGVKRKYKIGSFAKANKIPSSKRGFFKDHLGRIIDEKSRIEEKNRNNYLKDILNEDYGSVDSLYSYKATILGLQQGEKGFQYEAIFELKNQITEVANGYIVQLGSVIGSQAEIAFEERKRESNVYFGSQRKLENAITFEIPRGYQVSSLENLNVKVENEFGSFVSTATQSGNKIFIHTTKIYKVNYLDKKDWDKILVMLDAAYNFTQKKIVLTRSIF